MPHSIVHTRVVMPLNTSDFVCAEGRRYVFGGSHWNEEITSSGNLNSSGKLIRVFATFNQDRKDFFGQALE